MKVSHSALLTCLLLGGLVISPHSAEAACSVHDNATPPFFPLPLPIMRTTGAPGSLIAIGGPATGRNLGTVSISLPNQAFYRCDSASGTIRSIMPTDMIAVPGYTNYFYTNVPGIGMTLRNRRPAYLPDSASIAWQFNRGIQLFWQDIDIAFFHIGTISWTGTHTLLRAGEIYRLESNNGITQTLASYQMPSPIMITLSPPPVSCTVTTRDQSIDFEEFDAAASAKVGDIRLGLNCLNIPAGTTLPINLTLLDTHNPANNTDILNLAPDSVATGMGIKISQGGRPVFFGGAGRWQAGSAVNGDNTVQLTANLSQTGPTRPGTLKAEATFIVDYL